MTNNQHHPFGIGDQQPTANDSHNQEWHRHDFNAMGSEMSVWLEYEEKAIAEGLLRQVEGLFAAAEQRLTRFATTSELSQLNACSGQWRAVSNLLWAVLNRAFYLAEQTGGRFDPTLHNALIAAGYDRSFADLPTQDSQQHSLRAKHRTVTEHDSIHQYPVEHYPVHCQLPHNDCRGSWQAVALDPARHAVRIPAGVQLDLGGIGKGYTAQQAVNFLSNWGPCLVDAGGDLVAGDAPTTLPGWPVAIAVPSTDNSETPKDLAQLWLKNSALATSGTDYRRWQQGAVTKHHLIDPKTGEPTNSDLLTVSVLAADGSVAEAWAKALLLIGRTAAQEEAVDKGIAAALVAQSGQLTLSPPLQPFVRARFDLFA